MAINLATAYVTLTPTTEGIQGAIGKAFAGADIEADNAGQKSGGKFSAAIGGALKKGVKLVGVAAGGTLATALFKGWGRLSAIEDAQAKLAGLGNSTKTVQKIMDNALKSVKGTAFGLDEAATVAASAVAAGIKPGKDLQKTLSLVADAATIGGSSMTEMGGIFNKVAASNKVQGDTINQLNERGIPIVQMLAKTMGVTADQVTDLASKGKIDFATFRKAMESGLGGAAQKSGKTTSGAFKNMGAALSRFGAQLLTDVYPIAKTVFGSVTGLLDNMGGAIKSIGGFFKEHTTIVKILGIAMLALTGFLIAYKVAQVAAGVATKIVTAATKAWAVGQWLLNAALSANPIGLIVLAIAALVAGLIWAWNSSETFRNIVIGAFDVVKAYIGAWVTVIVALFTGVWNFITGTVQVVGSVITSVFSAVGAFIAGVWNGVVAAASGAWGAVQSIWSGITGFFSGLMSGVANVFSSAWKGIVSIASSILGGIKDAVGGAINTAISVVKGVINGAIGIVNGIIGGINTVIEIVNAIPLVPDISLIPKIPYLAAGGVTTGPTLAVIGEGKEQEAVLPLSKLDALLAQPRGNSAEGMQNTFYNYELSDPQATAAAMMRRLASLAAV